jgi:hypothetical protein
MNLFYVLLVTSFVRKKAPDGIVYELKYVKLIEGFVHNNSMEKKLCVKNQNFSIGLICMIQEAS